MSNRVSRTAIGLFIVVGLALGVAGLLLFGSWELFAKSEEMIVYFDNSLNGLSEGAPVKFRGVTVGFVKRVMIRFNQSPTDYSLPVVLKLEERLLRRLGDRSIPVFTPDAIERGIRNGLRATLQSQSPVTGVLYVGLDFQPNVPPPVFHQLANIYVEIPSRPTDVQQFLDNIASLDVKSVERNLNALLINVNGSLNSLNLGQLHDDITKVLGSVNRLASSPDLQNDLVALRTTLDQYRLLAEKLNKRVDPLADDLTRTLAEADGALVELRGAAKNARLQLAPDAPLPNDLDQTLHQVSDAAQSLSSLVEFLKQHPNALITGRANVDKKP